MGMKNKRITPQDRRNIINQVESGKLQKDIAVDFGISEAYVSKIVKESKQQTRPPAKSLESARLENLLNRLHEISREVAENYSEKASRLNTAMRLRSQLMVDTQTLQKARDDELRRITQASMSSTQRMAAWNEDHNTLDAHLIDLYAEQLSIFREFARRGQCLPVK